MFKVTLTIEIDAPTAKEAAIAFLRSIMTTDWSGGVTLQVTDDGETDETVLLGFEEYKIALGVR